ncbi:hypothetical protein C8R44DRAFT_893438 [Mycena epipterygia]|nr:hypothetical protein C8R44DRAFT_893438 [Mycena epipterygia]
MANIDALVDLLKATNPPTIPPTIEALSTPEYAQLALAYINNYPFTKSFNKTLDEAGRLRYKIMLSGFVNIDRTMFELLDATVDPAMTRRNFIRYEILKKRMELEEQGSKYWALLELGWSVLASFIILDAVSSLQYEDTISARQSFDDK